MAISELAILAEASSGINPTVVFQLLGSGTLVAVVTTIITGVVNRKKLGAEATSIITQAAGGIVKTLQDDNARLRSEYALMKVERDDQEDRERDRDARDTRLRRALELHERWDHTVTELLRSAGHDVPEPPTLTIP